MYLHHTDDNGFLFFRFGCMEAMGKKSLEQQMEEYRQWLIDHPDADPTAVSEIRLRIRELEKAKQEFINKIKMLDK